MPLKHTGLSKLMLLGLRVSVLFVCCWGIAAATTLATTANELQSLLLLLDDAGLSIEKRLPEQSQIQNSSRNKLPIDIADKKTMIAAIRQGSGNKQSAIAHRNLSSPVARWYADTGELLEVTNFVDPRVLRAPQEGVRVHGAIVAKTTARFLLRGPIDAVSVEVFLPDISRMIEFRPIPAPTTIELRATADGGTGSAAARSIDDGFAIGLSQQRWRFDL